MGWSDRLPPHAMGQALHRGRRRPADGKPSADVAIGCFATARLRERASRCLGFFFVEFLWCLCSGLVAVFLRSIFAVFFFCCVLLRFLLQSGLAPGAFLLLLSCC